MGFDRFSGEMPARLIGNHDLNTRKFSTKTTAIALGKGIQQIHLHTVEDDMTTDTGLYENICVCFSSSMSLPDLHHHYLITL